LFFDFLEAFPGIGVFFFLEGFAFDLELSESALDLVHFGGLAVNFHAEFGGGLVNEVNGLVGEVAVGDVAVCESCGGDECAVLDSDAVVGFVAFLETAEDSDGVLDGRFADVDGLEASFEGWVFFDVFSVFVEGWLRRRSGVRRVRERASACWRHPRRPRRHRPRRRCGVRQ